MSKYSQCPYCGKEPIITKDWCGHDRVECPDGHRKSASYAWNTTNEIYLKQFNKIINFMVGT